MKLLSDLLYDARILEVRGTTNLAVEDVAVDSRKVTPLGLFVAVPGTVVDGHDFISQALAAGAAGIVGGEALSPRRIRNREAKPVAVTATCVLLISRSAKFSAEKKDGRSFCTDVFGVGPWKKK